MKTNPLSQNEIPEEFHDFIDFTSQYRKEHNYPSGTKLSWVIGVICRDCGKERIVSALNIRQQVKKGKYTGLCHSCFNRQHMRRLNETGRSHRVGSDHGCWKGGARLTSCGYIEKHRETFALEERAILKPMFNQQNYVREHRAIMALMLGRALKDSEQIHHINGDKVDNRLTNLRLATLHGEAICRHCGYPLQDYQTPH